MLYGLIQKEEKLFFMIEEFEDITVVILIRGGQDKERQNAKIMVMPSL